MVIFVISFFLFSKYENLLLIEFIFMDFSLVCSVMYHTFIHCAHIPVMKCAATFDYIGISLLITASILITEYYSFYCSTSLSVFYITFTSLSGLIPIACSMFPWFDTKQFRLFRVVLF